ncbi:hypothetical protein vBPpSSYP_49 [Pseudomonas phage vB_PpS_SYP]|nr:hypothetical protein vBPpSSYP_49 [Pseudomonas phage vB_PpS_SYP]
MSKFKAGDIVTLKQENKVNGRNYTVKVLNPNSLDYECFIGEVLTSEFDSEEFGGLLNVGVVDDDFIHDYFELVKGE